MNFNLNKAQIKKITNVLLVIFVVTFVLGMLAYDGWSKRAKEEGVPEEDITFDKFFNGNNVTMKSVLIGCVSGTIFGFVDNAGLVAGMDALNPIFKPIAGGDSEVFAGLGNTFSSAVGAFMATFGGRIVADKFKEDEYPLWSEAIGIVIGSIIGIYLPKAFM